MSKPQKPAPTELEVLTSRLKLVEEKLDHVLHLQNPVTFGGRQLVRCDCRKLSTRTLVVDHPVHGTHSQYLCDDCKPSGYTAILAESCPVDRITTTVEPDTKALDFARRINGYLSFKQ